jgi:MFS transporter, NNP family, nitrate/nitrite transporter
MAQETLPPTTSPPRTAPAAGRGMALALATVGFAINFWAWSLLSPLAPRYQELLGLSPLAVSVMVAVPVIVGSLGRIPLGALTDRYGGRIVFAALSFAVIAPVLFLAFATSYPALLAGGLLLGLGGASFAVGVPFVNAWFPPSAAASPSASTAWATSAPPSPGSSPPGWPARWAAPGRS